MRPTALGVPITLDVEGARVVVVGADEEAARKVALLAEAGAQIAQLAPEAFSPAVLDGARLALVTPRDPALAEAVSRAARARGVLVWACDDAVHSDFAMPALARLGRARFAVSTGGASPALAGRLRAALERSLGDTFARFVAALGELRDRAQREEPDATRRRALLNDAVDGLELEITVKYPAWFE